MMPSRFIIALAAAAATLGPAAPPVAGSEIVQGPDPIGRLREVRVPFEDLDVVLEAPTRRVLLTRRQYETLLTEARRAPDVSAPRAAAIVAAAYEATVDRERTQILGALVVDVLETGLHAVALDLSGVGVRRVRLDGKAAPLGRSDDGRLLLFVDGAGRHDLAIELVAPLTTDSALQTLNVRVPTPASTQFHLTVPGDVEVEHGPAVMSRVFDPATETTRLEVVLDRDRELSLVMTLNSRLKREQRLVVARSVMVSEVTQAYEKLHATFSMGVLHRAVDRFRFEVPAGFEITDVDSPELAQWTVVDAAGGSELDVRLREAVGGTVVLGVSAVREAAGQEQWRFPRLRPLDVVSEAAVVGVLVEDRLDTESVRTAGLMPIDTAVLTRALPAGVLRAEPDAPVVRPIVAYYAPQASFDLAARVVRGPAQLRVTTNLLLTVGEEAQEVRGGFTVLPLEERCFRFDFSLPPEWQIVEVTGAGGETLRFDRLGEGDAEGPGRIRVRLPRGVAVGEQTSVYFRASSVPAGWLDDWTAVEVPFPVFAVVGATSDTGAIAVDTRDDIDVRPAVLERLLPLDGQEKRKFGLGNVVATLAYRYDEQPYRASLAAERTRPRVTARTFSFFRIEPDQRAVHYEIIYDIRRARTRRMSLLLPETTPTALSISGLDGVVLKGFSHEPAGDGMRRWTAILTEAHLGPVRLAIDFQQRVDHTTGDDLALPIVRAGDVAFQSGLLAVEGSSELEVEVVSHPRPVDVGELVDAEYAPGQRLIGAFGFVGDPSAVSIKSSRHPADAPPPAIVQRGQLATALAANGLSQTAARFTLRTKALFLEIRLPADAELWTITLDGRPTKPQRDGDRLVIDLSSDRADAGAALRGLVIVYESPVNALGLVDDVALSAPELRFLGQRGAQPAPVPIADLQWDVYLPPGYDLLAADGTVSTRQLDAPPLAIGAVARWLYLLGGGTPGPLWTRARGLSQVTSAGVAVEAEAAEADQLFENFIARRAPAAKLQAAADRDDRKPGPARTPRPSSSPPPPADKEEAAPRANMLGVRSLNIDLDRSGRLVTFKSLGVDPQVAMKLGSRRRVGFVAWTLALVVLLVGLARVRRSVASRARFVIWIGVLATLVAIVVARRDVTLVANAAFYAAALLVPLYLVLGGARWIRASLRTLRTPPVVPAPTAVAVAVMLTMAAGPQTRAQDRDDEDRGPPISVPDDAVIIPYDPGSGGDPGGDERLLVPFGLYVDLWNRVHPDEPIGADRPAPPFVMAGADYRGELRADRSDPVLTLTGHVEIDVFTDEPVLVPLALSGAVVASARVDGQPAKLIVTGAGDGAPAQNEGPLQRSEVGRAAPTGERGLVLHLSGRGRHELEVVLRARLEQQGGWRVTRAMIPTAPATSLTLAVPEAGTEVRLGGVSDRRLHQTTTPGEEIRTAIDPGAQLQIQWRPSVARGRVDLSLKAESTAVLDVQEDGVRLHWNVELEFPRGQRESFSVELPSAYLVEKVEGTNVRGWEIAEDRAAAGRQVLEVTLLAIAENRARFVVHLRRPWPAGVVDPDALAVPVLDVAGASLQSGTLVVRRSPVLDVRTVEATGVSRTDIPKAIERAVPADAALSPLGVRPLAAYRFVTTPYVVRLAVAAVPVKVAARLQTILRIAERERRLESRVLLDVQLRPIYLVRLLVPGDLELDHVWAAGSTEWSVQTQADGRRLLTVFMQTGQRGSVPVVIRGTLGARGVAQTIALPVISLPDVPDQEGDVVVQVDPAFDVSLRDPRNCESVLLNRLASWLQPAQRAAARLALHHRTSDYGAVFDLAARQPDVSCDIVTNVRLTDRAIEDTVLLDFTIRRAGIRAVSFLLPGFMADARISVPLLQRKTVEPVSQPAGWVRVRLDLQDEVMDRLRVLVESDRLLTPGGDGHRAPIPRVETGRTGRRYVALENAGRDELVVAERPGFEPLSRRQREWQAVASILQGESSEAYLARSDADDASLVFETKQRVEVHTAGARIGLAETLLALDAGGAYRATQIYRVDNSTEQYLEIELPEGADVWSVRVAGDPVKPARLLDPAKTRHARIPLVKTALGDLDYEVMIKYGGAVEALDRLSAVDVPLIRTVNINVELSQVRLFLPETYAWFDFGGTMRRVTEAGTFEAGYLSYQTKSVERLSETMRDANVYAQVRAAQNIEGLRSEIAGYQDRLGSLRGNEELRQQQASQSLALQSAAGELERLEAAPALAEVIDNRARLEDLWKGQRYARSKNVVQDLAGNFRSGEPAGDDAPDMAGGDRFRDGWIVANQLDADAEVAGEQQRLATVTGPDPAQRVAPGRPAAPEVAQRDVIDGLNADAGTAGSATRRGDEVAGKAGRYRRRLAERAKEPEPQIEGRTRGDRTALGEAIEDEAKPWPVGDMEFHATGGVGVGGGGAPRRAAVTAGLGLVGLDVELPQRGVEYRFTTPRGDVGITARAVSTPVLITLQRLGVFTAVVGMLLGVRRVLRGRVVAPLARGKLGIVLIIVGFAGFGAGVLPNAAALLVAVGIVVAVRAHLERRAALA